MQARGVMPYWHDGCLNHNLFGSIAGGQGKSCSKYLFWVDLMFKGINFLVPGLWVIKKYLSVSLFQEKYLRCNYAPKFVVHGTGGPKASSRTVILALELQEEGQGKWDLGGCSSATSWWWWMRTMNKFLAISVGQDRLQKDRPSYTLLLPFFPQYVYQGSSSATTMETGTLGAHQACDHVSPHVLEERVDKHGLVGSQLVKWTCVHSKSTESMVFHAPRTSSCIKVWRSESDSMDDHRSEQ